MSKLFTYVRMLKDVLRKECVCIYAYSDNHQGGEDLHGNVQTERQE